MEQEAITAAGPEPFIVSKLSAYDGSDETLVPEPMGLKVSAALRRIAPAAPLSPEAVLSVARQRVRFSRFIATGLSGPPQEVLPEALRRLQAFGLGEVAQRYTSQPATAPVLAALRAELLGLLETHEAIWRLPPDGRPQAFISVAAPSVIAASLADASRSRRTPRLRDVLGPLRARCAALAAARGKRVSLTIDGGSLPLSADITPAIAGLDLLLTNAVEHGIEAPEDRHGKAPTGQIRLCAEQTDAGLTITVADDGRGIPLPALRALRESQRAGSGLHRLGLSVVARGGSIEVDSAPGIGTLVTVTVPCAVARQRRRAVNN